MAYRTPIGHPNERLALCLGLHVGAMFSAYGMYVNITVFGASRGVGLAAIDVAAARGHVVTAVARSSGFLAGHSGVAMSGDVLDSEFVARAINGADAVLVALGTAPGQRAGATNADVCSRGTRVVLDAMRATTLRRIIVVSSYGIGPTRDRRPFPFNVVAATLLKDVMADKELQEQAVRDSNTDWTIVQPLGLTDAPATGAPLVSTDGQRKSTRVARADVATVCVEAIEQRRYVLESIAISASK